MTAGGTPRRCRAVPRAGHHAAGLVGTLADSASFCHGVVSVHRVGNVPGDRCSAIELSCEWRRSQNRHRQERRVVLSTIDQPDDSHDDEVVQNHPQSRKSAMTAITDFEPGMRRASLCHVATRSRPSSMNCLTVAIAMGASGQTHIPVTRRIRIRRIRSTGYGEWLRICQSDDLSNRSRSNGCRRKNRRRPGRRAATTVGDAIVRISAAPGSAVQRGGSAT